MKVAVIGTGGVGGYFGGRLADAGVDVTFVARGEHFKAIQKSGLLIRSILGDFHLKQCKVTDEIEAIQLVDLVIIGVKAWQVSDVTEGVREILKEDGLILPLQNGVLVIDQLEKTFNKHNVLGGVCKILSKVESPGIINHFGVEPSIVFGSLEDEPNDDRLVHLKSMLDQAGIANVISRDIRVDIWKKFAFICVGGLLAVHRVPLNTLRQFPESRKKMIGLITEIFDLAAKMGIHLGENYLNRTIGFIDSLPEETTFSLSRDIWEGRPSELDYQNGAVVKLGEQYGMSTPINRTIYMQLQPLEKMARSKAENN